MFDDRSDKAAPSQQAGVRLSGPMQVDLSVYRGDSGRFRISVTNVTGDPIDISTAAWDADIRVKAADTETIASFDVQPVVDDISSIDVILTATTSDILVNSVYDVEMRMGGEVTTLVRGSITVTEDVSRP